MNFSRWFAPYVGMMLGVGVQAAIGLMGKSNFDGLGFWPPLFMGAGLGLVGGIVAMLADTPKRPLSEDPKSEKQASPNFSGNALCVLSFIFFFMPIFNIVLAGLALACNWKVGGWRKA